MPVLVHRKSDFAGSGAVLVRQKIIFSGAGAVHENFKNHGCAPQIWNPGRNSQTRVNYNRTQFDDVKNNTKNITNNTKDCHSVITM